MFVAKDRRLLANVVFMENSAPFVGERTTDVL